MTEREIQVVDLLVGQNTDRPDSTTCADGVICYKVSCSECPLNVKGTTIGEVRTMKDSKGSAHFPECKIWNGAGQCTCEPTRDDGVKQPSHYQLFDGVEAIEVIARSMTQEMFKGYCLGNILKYRLRAGKKSELATLEKDMAKAAFYLELYTKHKGLCYDAK
ncbi:nucleotide kinase [Klebsiella phage K11]|uniref:Gp1.7 n=1 Tax=Enterobacteria phage K11 TaxID=532077 RepID=B3VCY8_BPK11|nr:nucleotide kinase [Klebsiella phage K11]ACF15843.1 gp1.7 [Klebsiella phage K11]